MKPPSPTRLEAVASDRPPQRMSPALMQRRLRDIHLYLGMLFAPTLLFFALTGALQLYNLHEVRPGRAFEPPALLQKLGVLHKDQEFRLPHRRAAPPALPASTDATTAGQSPAQTPAPQVAAPQVAAPSAPAPAAAPEERSPPEWAIQVLKAFCLLAALALATSTGLGIWLGVRTGRHRTLAWGLLALGIVVPVALLAI